MDHFVGTGPAAPEWQLTREPKPSEINRRVLELRRSTAMRSATRRYDHRVNLCLAWKAGCAGLLGLDIVSTKPRLGGPALSDLVGSLLLGVLMLAILVLTGVLIVNQARSAHVVRQEAIRQLTTRAR